MRPRANLRKPAIFTRRILSLIVRAFAITSMSFGIAFGFLLFGDVPSWFTLGGAVVVAASGTYNAYRERVRRAESGR